jgi:hypothetical protein
MCSERKHGLSTEQVPASAFVGSSKNLQDPQAEWHAPHQPELPPRVTAILMPATGHRLLEFGP